MVKQLSCEDVLSQLYDYLDSEIDGPTEEDINHHLHHCRECFSRAEFEKMLRKKVSETGESQAPEDVKARLASLIKRF